MKFILNFIIFSSQNGSMTFKAPLLEYFPIPSTDWVSQINVTAWFQIVSNYYNKKHEN